MKIAVQSAGHGWVLGILRLVSPTQSVRDEEVTNISCRLPIRAWRSNLVTAGRLGEIAQRLIARWMLLAEDDLALRAFGRSPVRDPALQGTQMPFVETAGMVAADLLHDLCRAHIGTWRSIGTTIGLVANSWMGCKSGSADLGFTLR